MRVCFLLTTALAATLFGASVRADGGLPLPNGQTLALHPESEGRAPQRYIIEGSGSLVVEPDGRVSEVDLDMKPSIREAYRKAIESWTFKPVTVDGRIVRARTYFNLQGFGVSIDGSRDVRLGVENVWFLDPPADGGRPLTVGKPLQPPTYPSQAALEAFGATVTLLVKVAVDGRVEDVGVASLSLDTWDTSSPRRAERFARSFAERALQVAEDWSFAGHPMVEAGGTVFVPVTFIPPQRPRSGWRPQVPVEVTQLPWMVAAGEQAIAMAPSGAMPSGAVQLSEDVAGTMIN